MDLEFQQLELRYERLRLLRPARERQLLSSLAASGQQVPIVVVADAEESRFVVVDGYKRVRCLQKLVRDVVLATRLDLGEMEALVMKHQMSAADSETALEQAWLLDELARRFGLTQDELARRFDRSVSWVSRRLALVRELPDSVQERVRSGEIVAHGAVKYLVPLARAKKSDCEGLVAAVAAARLSSRDLGLLYTAWRDGTTKTRERLLAAPLVFLKAIKEAQAGRPSDPGPGQKLLNDLDLMGAVARRAHKQLREGAGRRLLPGEGEGDRPLLRAVATRGASARRTAAQGGVRCWARGSATRSWSCGAGEWACERLLARWGCRARWCARSSGRTRPRYHTRATHREGGAVP